MQENETEIVFLASAKQIVQLPHVLQDLAASVTGRPLRTVQDQYLDTPTRLLMRAGVACRLRQTGKQVTLTLKSLTPLRGGFAERVEASEKLVPGNWMWPGPLPGQDLHTRLLPLTRRLDVQCLFALDQKRRVYEVRTRDGTRVEVSADRASLIGADCGKVFCRIEIELRTGSSASLRRFASHLRRQLKLKPAAESKFEYGLREAGLRVPVLAERPALRIRSGDSVRTAVGRALLRQFRRMLWHVPGTRLGVNPECLHDMRVSVRRMRAILRLFRTSVPPGAAAKLAEELKWLGRSLGAVRDLDVHLSECVIALQHMPEAPRKTADRCRLEMGRRRERAYEDLRRDLDSRRFIGLQSTCRSLIRQLQQLGVADSAKLGAVGASLMKAELRRILKDGRAVTADTPDAALHRLRVRCKRLRYACETLSDLDGKPMAKMARRLAALQDVLGAHQDAVTAQALIERAIAETATSTSNGTDDAQSFRRCAVGWQEEALVRRAAFPKAWKVFDRKKVRRAFLKAISCL